MKTCEICKKQFKTIWHLRRHINNKKKCSEIKVLPKFNQSVQNFNQFLPKFNHPLQNFNHLLTQNNHLSSITLKCKYCLQSFSRKNYLNSHINICKSKEDVVRCLEIQLDKQVILNNDSICRFCSYKFSTKQNLQRHYKSCKQRSEYKDQLEYQLQLIKDTKHITIVNNTNNINNNYSLTFNNEEKMFICNYPNAPTNQLLSFDGFKHESKTLNLDIDNDKLQSLINNLLESNVKDYDSFWRFFFRDTDKKFLQMIMLKKNNNETHASVLNSGTLQSMEKHNLYESVITCVGFYSIYRSKNMEIIQLLKEDNSCKNSFFHVIKEHSPTFEFFKNMLNVVL